MTEDISFEDALTKLEDIVYQLESGHIKLEEAVSAYEKGCALKKICEEKLQNAKERIDKLIIQNNEIIGKESENDIIE
ncbi:MAG: exodeoxyribonuclease VII small subunit [Alphaproteobacteria bacterium]|nr:exodeoxyribonuclease VII small subunit [Alphaproteobacteria bacterium]